MSTLSELTPLWDANGTGILAAIAVDSPLLPRGREIERDHSGEWAENDGEDEQSMMIALRIPEQVGARYTVEAGEGLDPAPLQDRHVTLVYLGRLPQEERQRAHRTVRQWLAEGDWSLLEGRPQGWGTFNPSESSDGRTVLWMGWDVPGLAEMREDLAETLRDQGFPVADDFDFLPHETVAYTDDGIREIPAFPSEDIEHVFSGVVVTDGSRWTEYDFPMAMALREGSTMSLVAALEAAEVRDGLAAALGVDTLALDVDLLGEGAPGPLRPASDLVASATTLLPAGVGVPGADMAVSASVASLEETGVDSPLDVLLMRDGFQMVRVDAVQDAAQVVEVPDSLRATGAVTLGERADAGLPDEAVRKEGRPSPAHASVAVQGLDVPRPQQAGSEVGSPGRVGADHGAGADRLLAGSALGGDAGGGVARAAVDLVVTPAQSQRRILDLPIAALDAARSSGKGAALAVLQDGSRRRIAVGAQTPVVSIAEFLGKDGAVATIYGADGRTRLASASLWVSGGTPALVVSAAPPSDLGGLRAALDGTSGHWLSLVAAGSVKGHTTGAARLKAYWLTGKGALKIRWRTPGDWKRCVRQLSKYMGPRAKGYCQNLHRIANGRYTGDMKERIKWGWGGIPGPEWARRAANSISANDGMNHTGAVLTAAGDEIMDMDDATNPLVMLLGGNRKPMGFRIPLLLPEDVESGDGRTFKREVVDFRDLPLPLLWQPNSMQGHDGAVIVGRMDSMERTEDGIGNVTGVFDTSPSAAEAVRLIQGKFLRGVSADLDRFEAKIKGKGPGVSTAETDEDGGDEDETITADKMDITKGRIMAATLVAKPAFQEAQIELIEPEPDEIADGDYSGDMDPAMEELAREFARMVTEGDLATLSNGHTLSLVASGMQIPVEPPEAWFADPGLTKPTHLTVTDDGRIFGHIAAWNVDHIGMGFGTKPPRSRTGYAYFRTGLLRTAEGNDIRVGQITLVGGHAPLSADARGAVRHYDDTKSAFADVIAGEDRHGIWVSGALRPEVTAAQLRAIRAASPSGDWRPINGRLELVAICQVNVPGFPVVEARVASGQVLALVAAGTAPLMADFLGETHDAAALSVMATQAKATVMAPLAAQAASARATMMAPLQQQALAAQASMAKHRMLRSNVSDERREKLTEKGKALPSGAFPIGNVTDLRRAIQAYGRARKEDRAKVRRHIIRRARGLGRPDLIPEGWSEAAAAEHPSTFEPLPFTPSKAGLASLDPAEPVNPEALTAAATLGRPDLLPEEWDEAFAEATGISAALVASIRSVRRKAWEEAKVSRDDIGRFRKIYYRLRQSPASAKPEIRAALRAIKEAERVAETEGATDQESTELARDLIEEAAASGSVDERTQVDLIEAASDMADLMRRFEVRGDDTFMSFDQLPTEIQNALERYMTTGGPKEERIEKHFGPFVTGETNRSIKDILNLIERVIVDAQGYQKNAYDRQNV